VALRLWAELRQDLPVEVLLRRVGPINGDWAALLAAAPLKATGEAALLRVDLSASLAALTGPAETGAGETPDVEETAASVREVSDHIEMIDSLVAFSTRSAEVPARCRSNLSMMRRHLFDLRSGLEARRLSRSDATSRLRSARHALRVVDEVLEYERNVVAADERVLVDELAETSEVLAHQLTSLSEEVMRLFRDVNDIAELVPVG
jgi:hypothetical protein